VIYINTKVKIILISCISFLVNIIWILGLIFTNINYFILSMVLLVILLPFVLKDFNEFNEFFKKGKYGEDERQTYIKEQSGYMTYGITLALTIYSAIAIITLRNQYPEYQIIAYTLIVFILISFIIYGLANFYYKRKYS